MNTTINTHQSKPTILCKIQLQQQGNYNDNIIKRKRQTFIPHNLYKSKDDRSRVQLHHK